MAGQIWYTAADGGYLYAPNLSEVMRTVLQNLVRFRSFCDMKSAHGHGKGDRFYWNIYSKVANAGGEVTEGNDVQQTKFTIRQESLIVKLLANSIPYTKLTEVFGTHDVETVIREVLANDAKEVIDLTAAAAFDAAPVTIEPVAGTSATAVQFTSGAPTVANNIELTKAHVRAIALGMQERNVTGFDGENYIGLGRPATFTKLKDELEAISQYVDAGFDRISNGEIGRYEAIRFHNQTNKPSEAWASGKSDAAYFFGADTVCEGVAMSEEIRAKLGENFGLNKAIGWVYIGGFGLSHTDPTDARVFKWGSTG